MQQNCPVSNDDRTPDGADGPADDMWARLQQLGDLGSVPLDIPAASPPVHRSDEPAPAGVPDDFATRVVPPVASTPPPAAANPSAGRQYFVPAPGSDVAAAGVPPGAGGSAAAAVTPSPIPPKVVASQTVAGAAARYGEQQPAAPAPAAAFGGGDGGKRRGGPPDGAAPRSRKGGILRPKAKWFRPKLRWLFLYLPLLIMLLIGGVGVWGWMTFNDLYRVELGDSLQPATGDAVNYLIVGSDSREGIEADTENVGAIGTQTEVGGRRSDTIIVLRVAGDTATMMSIPRDLWVTNVATGKSGRINGTYAAGPDNLVRSVTANLGIPINRYVEVDFVSFGGMVDAMGGIDIDFAHPVIDFNSGLKIGTAGVQKLDGPMALAYVRSRHYTESIDGKPVQDPTADLGRQTRQQNFIRTVLSTVGETRNPLTLARVGAAAAQGVRVDSEVGFTDLISLARQLGGADPETKVLPTEGASKGGASVLVLKNAEALPILAEFGAGR